jgi:1,4-alpha-glucan branching enzyme
MGQEFGAHTPFQFFCDFGPELAAAVARGRLAEFARFGRFAAPAERRRIPDPNDVATFERSRLDWSEIGQAEHAAWLAYHHELLAIRRSDIVPLLAQASGGKARARMLADTAFEIVWSYRNARRLTLVANLADTATAAPVSPAGRLLHATPSDAAVLPATRTLEPWSVRWYVSQPT